MRSFVVYRLVLTLFFVAGLTHVLEAATPRSRTRAKSGQTTSSQQPINLAIAENPSTAPIHGRLPRRYKLMAPDELSTEVSRLRESAQRLPSNGADREHINELVRAIELYQKTGSDPEALLDEITSVVAELRGLEPKGPVVFRILERDALKKLLEEKLEEDLPAGWLGEYEFACKVVGAIPERTSLRKTLLSLLSEQIGGLYDDKTKRLYVMADFDLSRPLAKIILAHEICHAIQDQHYDFSRLPLRDFVDNDRATAALSIVEGDATILMQEYAADSLQRSDLIKLLDVFKVDQKALNSSPYFLRQQLIFPYMGGAEFLMKVMLQNPDLRELAFVRPPASTEQILHPDKYATGDLDMPTTVTIPDLQKELGDGWKLAMRSNWGEFQIKTLLEVWREWNKAKWVAGGWDGDQYVTYRKGNEYAYFWVTAWDTSKDSKEFFDEASELMRTKRYKVQFAGEKFSGLHDDERMLSYKGKR